MVMEDERLIRRMSPISTPRSSAYLSALTQEIEKKLQRALASPSQRRNLLQELFADLALEVDDQARSIMLRSEEEDDDVISPSDNGSGGQLCFYDVLADYYVWVPQSGKHILDLIVQLWCQSFASHIFSLLFHKWLFEAHLENSEVLLRYSSALVQGATNVFWIDIQTNTRRFQSLFRYLLEEVALVPTRLDNIALQAQRDLYLLLSRSTSKVKGGACTAILPFPHQSSPGRRLTIRATETDANDVKPKAPSNTPAGGGLSFNQLLEIKGASQETETFTGIWRMLPNQLFAFIRRL